MHEDCQHEHFEASVFVNRITDEEGGPVRRYQADVQIHCLSCGRPFEFIGIPGGVSFSGPSHGFSQYGEPEGRFPIRPAAQTGEN